MSLWLVRGGRHGEHEAISLENGLAVIGFVKYPDLSKSPSREAILEVGRELFPDDTENRLANLARQLFAFSHGIKKGDLVAMPLKNKSRVALGRVTGAYQYRTDLGELHHTRPVEWVRPDVPRTDFGQDLLYSLGAFMTVCQIQRNQAEKRLDAMLAGKRDPGLELLPTKGKKDDQPVDLEEQQVEPDVEQVARDQIMRHIQAHFRGHDLTWLVEAVLRAEGYVTSLAPPGPDGGVDILAGRGPLGFEKPRLCVQVKSSESPADVTVFRSLQGSMSTFKADQGLLVSWGGFNTAVEKEARMSYFSVRLWDATALIEAVQRNYDRLTEELQGALPLKQVWALVPEGSP